MTKTLVGTPDPEPRPVQPQAFWSASNTASWIVWHAMNSTVAVTFNR